MNKILTILFSLGFLVTSTKSYSQNNLSKKFDLKILQLKKQKIDTIITYQNYFNGNTNFIQSKKDTNSRATIIGIVFWVDKGKMFKQRFDNCRDYPVTKISPSPFISLVLDSISKIEIAQIQPVKFNSIDKDGKPIISISSVSHSERTRFTFLIKDKEFAKNIDHYDIETKTTEDGHPNINYDENQNTILIKLIDHVKSEQ